MKANRRVQIGVSGVAVAVAAVVSSFAITSPSTGAAHAVVPSRSTVDPAAALAAKATPAKKAKPKPTKTTLVGKWKYILNENFSGTSLNTNIWQPGWFGTGVTPSVNSNDRACNSSSQVKVSGGLLRITAKREDISCGGEEHKYVSGVVGSDPAAVGAGKGFQFTYGLIEFRAKIPHDTKGRCANWAALWTNGQHWPDDGEMDAFECLKSVATFNLHSGKGHGASPTVSETAKGKWTGWHTYAIDWERHKATTYYDGKRMGSHSYSVPHPNYVMISNEIRVGSKIVLPSTLEVDWVKVWQHSTAKSAKRVTLKR
jgi:beta-glucanase (GH16 family)